MASRNNNGNTNSHSTRMITANCCLVTVRVATHEGTGGNGRKEVSRRYVPILVDETKSAFCVYPKLILRLFQLDVFYRYVFSCVRAKVGSWNFVRRRGLK